MQLRVQGDKKSRVCRTEYPGGKICTERITEICRKSPWSIILSTSWHFCVKKKLFWARKKPWGKIRKQCPALTQDQNGAKIEKNLIHPWHTGLEYSSPPLIHGGSVPRLPKNA